uniref:NADH dehydrogenase subunit 6 n=1 Tax=Pontinus rathbuni TaxID=1311485 RepID=UPI0028D1DBF0|nr:NADH dehydrogenase subunit 6 [Pontinus rathbuni]WMY90277.1 NADH dehydrogenase subunit 6 [Pontinus rathbuni]WMY90290.1 NADH dehydrogenase subunit 6 [Pontinus rathbuni]
MTYIMSLFLFGLVVGLVAVASSPSPYFAALGLVVAAGMGCGALVGHGGPFLSLVLFLIYLGGMLVVFAYSVALAAEPHPESWVSGRALGDTLVYLMVVGVALVVYWEEVSKISWVPGDEHGGRSVFRVDIEGIAILYSLGGVMLVVCGWVLLLTLFVVLELTRGLGRGALRAV